MPESCEEQLESLKAEFEAFAYIVSHDLKAPVRAIGNLASWIEEDLNGNFPGESEENFRLLKNRSIRLTNMIEALLEYSRVNRYNLEISETDVSRMLTETAEKLKQTKPFDFYLSGNVPKIKTYQNKLAFVLKELLENAIEFNNKPLPQIHVTLSELPDAINITIADNGPGIPAGALEKVCTIFYTVAPKDQQDNTGAGLAIVNKIVNFVNGKFTLTNQPEGGLQVELCWPKNSSAN